MVREPTKLSDKLLNLIPPILNDADNELVMCQVTEEEVKEVVFAMAAYKASGPDGFPPTFFQVFWEIVKYDLIKATRDFIQMGNLLKKLNNTFIVSVPKVPYPKLIIDFRPISLCNMVYKIFSKVVVNRIKPLLDRDISPSQRVLFRVGRSSMRSSLLMKSFIPWRGVATQVWL
ncbi:uncharacterized protein LOC131860358 [Cryptomeria japonica]|uniref:uncharacterized protein LOC131860358 n=1 Tax=Cryptomeria japonica TaxID=3369 RepID=UPI0027DA0BA5|nr:uncharacterized protein LOC131860358 [Cryptomeria japonica]